MQSLHNEVFIKHSSRPESKRLHDNVIYRRRIVDYGQTILAGHVDELAHADANVVLVLISGLTDSISVSLYRPPMSTCDH